MVFLGCLCLMLGLLLALAGRRVGRVIAALAAAAAGAAAAPLVVQLVHFRGIWIVALAGVVTAGLFGFLLTRLLWAALLGLALGVAVLVFWAGFPGPTTQPTGADRQVQVKDLSGWFGLAGAWVGDWAKALWLRRPVLVVAALLLPVAFCVGLELFFPRSVLIFITAVVGAALAVGGAGLVAEAIRTGLLRAWAGRPAILAGLAGAVAVLGVSWQVRGQWRDARRRREAKEAEGGGGGARRLAGKADAQEGE